MIAEVLALFVAFLWAVGSILARKGLQSSDALTGAFVRIIISIVIFGFLFILLLPFNSFQTEAILYHGIAGIFGGFIAMTVSLIAIKKVGVAVSSTVMASQSLFSFFGAIIVLGETATIPIVVGTILVVLGVSVLSFGEHEKRRWVRTTLVFPFLSAFLYAIVNIPTKLGVELTKSPVFGATVETASALGCFVLFLLITRTKLTVNKDCLGYFILAGLCGCLGLLSLFYALSYGDVLVVVPLIGTSPIFALFLTHVFLKKIEKITHKIIVATIVIVLGSTLISAF